MNSDQFSTLKSELKEHVELVIEKKVNGKIDNLQRNLDSYIENDNKWKSDAQKFRNEELIPLVKTRERFRFIASAVKWTAATIVMTSAVIGATVYLKGFISIYLNQNIPHQSIQTNAN